MHRQVLNSLFKHANLHTVLTTSYKKIPAQSKTKFSTDKFSIINVQNMFNFQFITEYTAADFTCSG